ncbi:hypothetical protein GCM10010517_36710 [Streptosporangium fragile]|uniref:Helix-turn-helix domain-containing protein n=1 Tax=Streptosporangium fragile TaxID=46186 RepID=A0ABP6IG86_9ACTN
MQSDDELVYTVDETVAKLKIAKSRVFALIKSGAIESILIDGPRTRRIPRSALVDYIERLRAEQNGSAA